MTAAAAPRALRGRREPGSARFVIARHVARSALPWAVLWGTVFGLFVIATIRAFVTAYPTLAARREAAASLESFSILLGVPRHAETVAGFTSWRVLVAVALIGAIWGLLTSTGLLRGEEDSGRWELLLGGPTTKRRATAEALLGLALGLAAMFAVTALLTIAAGRLPGARFGVPGALLFSVALVSGAAMFLAIGALTSQLSATRGQAAMIGAAVLGVSYVVRMITDATSGLGWLRWFSPIGWIEEVRPLRDPQPAALAPMAALIIVCVGLTLVLAGRRDLYASVLPEREGGGRGRWLLGPATLALRLAGPSALAWLAGIAGFGLMLGFVARSAAGLLASSPAFTATLGRLGVRKGAEGYLGVAFFMVAVLIALMAANQVAALRDEEASGRLDNLLVRPVSRMRWLTGRLAISVMLTGMAGATAGFFAWTGAASQHAGVALPRLLEAGLNATAPGVLVAGAAVLVFGLRPRLTAAAAYGIVAWSFLANLLGSLTRGNEWLRDSSIFSHIALAPAAKPDWEAVAVMMLLGLAATALGAIAFVRRDIEYR